MSLIREHAFANGRCVWCPATESSINTAKAENKAVPVCAERWADDPAKPRVDRAADDFDVIRERREAIRAEQDKALAGTAPPSSS